MKNFRKLSRFWQIVIPAVILLLLVGGAYVGYRQFFYNPPTTIDGQPVNLEPATEEDKAQAEAHKEEIVEQDKAIKENPSGTGPKTVAVVITGADQTAGRAYVTGVFEDDGSCLATASMGSQKATASSLGFRNVSYTQCAPLTWNTPLTPGSWSITVTYKSATASGSQTSTVEVK